MDNGRNTIIRSVLMIGLVKIKNPYQDMYRSPNSLRLRGACLMVKKCLLMTRLIFQPSISLFGCENDVNLSFSDRLLMCKNTILIYYQHMGQFFLVGAKCSLTCL